MCVSYDVVMFGLASNDDADKRFHYGPGGAGAPYILSQLTGSYQQGPSFLDNQHTIENKADADAYLARLEGFAKLMDQEIEVQRHDMGHGRVRAGLRAGQDGRPDGGAAQAGAGRLAADGIAGAPHQGQEHRRRLGGARPRSWWPTRSIRRWIARSRW